jgi:hypothetical protein
MERSLDARTGWHSPAALERRRRRKDTIPHAQSVPPQAALESATMAAETDIV